MQLRKRTLSRLLAVQGIYHLLFERQNLMFEEELAPIDWAALATATLEVLKKDFELESVSYDEAFYLDLVQGVADQREALEERIRANLTGRRFENFELMLQSLLLSAAFELVNYLETPVPVLIEEYLALTDAFFSQQESKLIHGVLYGLSKVRETQ